MFNLLGLRLCSQKGLVFKGMQGKTWQMLKSSFLLLRCCRENFKAWVESIKQSLWVSAQNNKGKT